MKIWDDGELTSLGIILIIICFFAIAFLMDRYEKRRELKPIPIIDIIYRILKSFFVSLEKPLINVEKYKIFFKKLKVRLSQDYEDCFLYKGNTMNIYQRIVLVLGAISLPIVVLTSPRGDYISNSFIKSVTNDGVIHLETALLRVVLVIGCTLLLFFALKGIHKEKGDNKNE